MICAGTSIGVLFGVVGVLEMDGTRLTLPGVVGLVGVVGVGAPGVLCCAFAETSSSAPAAAMDAIEHIRTWGIITASLILFIMSRTGRSGSAKRVKCEGVAGNKLQAVIVDDEELARAYLRELLRPHPEVEIAAECANGFEALKAIGEVTPDLLFLDVQMPKLDGFEVLELVEPGPAGPPVVIFVTAYDQYAMRAFDAHAVDYLLKPFDQERFERALERAKLRLGERTAATVPLAQAARAPGQRLERVVVRDGAKVHVIPLDKLDYVEAQDDYIALCSAGKQYLKQQPIAALEEQLDPARFVRIHRSVIVNLERVTRIEPYTKDSRVAILGDGTQLPVSRTGYTRLLEAMEGSQGNRNPAR
jgi:two-component system LytT family response regulator